MTPVAIEVPARAEHAPPPIRLLDDRRGTFAMALFITTEATLFVILFFVYYYIEKGNERWHVDEPPKLHYSLPMLGVLATSSLVLYWGEKQLEKRKPGRARAAVVGTIFLGLVFLTLTYFEYTEHLKHLTPRTDSYGSIFYTITSLHGLHVVLGLFMLTWVLSIPRYEPARDTPHRPYHNVAMYWHFVDTVWVFIIALLYVGPNVYNAL